MREDNQKEFTKADLKDGMVAELRNKQRYFKLGERLLNFDGWMPLNNYVDNLCDVDTEEEFDIVKVFKVNTNRVADLKMVLRDEYLEPVWKRDEVKHMTVEEIRQKLEELTGEKIEVEPSKGEMMGTCYEFCKKQDCSSNCILYRIGSCAFKNYTDEQLKQCYEKVMEDGQKES